MKASKIANCCIIFFSIACFILVRRHYHDMGVFVSENFTSSAAVLGGVLWSVTQFFELIILILIIVLSAICVCVRLSPKVSLIADVLTVIFAGFCLASSFVGFVNATRYLYSNSHSWDSLYIGPLGVFGAWLLIFSYALVCILAFFKLVRRNPC